jgi:hypothetical protein
MLMLLIQPGHGPWLHLPDFAKVMAKNFLLENRRNLRQSVGSIYGCKTSQTR